MKLAREGCCEGNFRDPQMCERRRGGLERAELEEPVRVAVAREPQALELGHGGSRRGDAGEGIEAVYGERDEIRERCGEELAEKRGRGERAGHDDCERLQRRGREFEETRGERPLGVEADHVFRREGHGVLARIDCGPVGEEEASNATKVGRGLLESGRELRHLVETGYGDGVVQIGRDGVADVMRDERERANSRAVVDASKLEYLRVELEREGLHVLSGSG